MHDRIMNKSLNGETNKTFTGLDIGSHLAFKWFRAIVWVQFCDFAAPLKGEPLQKHHSERN